jgi:hypothetical protein
MGRKTLVAVIILGLSMLACSLPGVTISFDPTNTPIPPAAGGVTPPGVGVTPAVPPLPPPAVAPLPRAAYVKSGNIWLWTDGGGTVQLTASGSDSSPRLSSDGGQVAFLRGGELWAVNADGSSPRVLVSAAYLSGLVPPASGTAVIHWFDWVPAASTLWFNTSTAGGPFTVPNDDLYAVSAGGGSAPVLLAVSGNGGNATFSPNGVYAAVAQGTRIILMNTDGSGARNALTYQLVQTYSEWVYVPEIVWFADSSQFRTVIPAHDALGDPSEGTYFWSVPVSGSPMEMAGFTAVPAFMDAPRISPDGLNVAYFVPAGDNSELHLNGFYIGDEMYSYYLANRWGLVGWAPDSAGFVYWADDARSLWLGRVGSPALRLTDTDHAEAVRWLDTSRFLFVSDGSLRLGTPAMASNVIDAGVDRDYDVFVP